ncbi:damage-inducible protein DinB [Brucepastera parasyntrophica]|uniref:DinB family protein n=1 Tax=Brucepastera parasyntrophica TaxID=2880008 RepID=UPI0021088BB8|nr:DinB family protein [Brucepastera parasyntrophica]ULQ60237.1 damage-inducible protein DinB [Brucepastera parasyntrophica]
MQEIIFMYTQYIKQTNETVVSLLNCISHEEREKDRGSFYGGLSELVRHILGGTIYFHSLFRDSLPAKVKALKALDASRDIVEIPEKAITEEQWEHLTSALAVVDHATINFASRLTEKDLKLPVKLDWYGGKPPSVPLFFLFHQLIVHVIHHQGQISQILDEMEIDHDFSGINIAFMPQ